ncbi:MAG: DUF5361 domain-containing protein [Prevotellaceae bacterium]|nr:DUF5361 domain-containing protein [Prevotellaceae bacterium]
MCEEEIICDLAETYHVLNYQELSPSLVATLVLGLRNDSRVKMKLSKTQINTEQMMLASIFDDLQFLCWTKTTDGQHNRNRPKSLLKKLMGDDEMDKDNLMSFSTPEEYEAHMASIRGF